MKNISTELDEDFLSLSARLGSDPLLIQGAGGNTSIKVGPSMWVKASGKWLRDSLALPIFLALDRQAALEQFLSGDAELRDWSGPANLRPSIETLLHVCLPQRVVLHLHSINTLAVAVSQHGCRQLEKKLNGLDWRWIPYVKPGLPLAHAIHSSLGSGGCPDVFVLQNHGLVVAGESPDSAEGLLEEVENRLRVEPGLPALPEMDDDLHQLASPIAWKFPKHPEVHFLGRDPLAFEIVTSGVLCPDQAVFLGARSLILRSGEDPAKALSRYKDECGTDPAYLIVDGHGVLVSPSITQGAEEMLMSLALLTMRVLPETTVSYLSEGDVGALLDWEPEKYRQATA